MILGIGVDLCSQERIAKLWSRFGQRLIERLCHPSEQHLLSAKNQQTSRLARMFAAKEAAVKALGSGFRQGIGPRQLALQHDTVGKPQLLLYGNARNRLEQLLASRQAANWDIMVSLSDERTLQGETLAVAMVVIDASSALHKTQYNFASQRLPQADGKA